MHKDTMLNISVAIHIPLSLLSHGCGIEQEEIWKWLDVFG